MVDFAVDGTAASSSPPTRGKNSRKGSNSACVACGASPRGVAGIAAGQPRGGGWPGMRQCHGRGFTPAMDRSMDFSGLVQLPDFFWQAPPRCSWWRPGCRSSSASLRVVNFAHGSLYMLGLFGAHTCVEQAAVCSASGGAAAGAGWPWACWARRWRCCCCARIYRAPGLLQLLATFAWCW